VISGPHRGQEHANGQAIDLGGDVGLNRHTWDFLIRAVQSGRFKRIGTLAPLVQQLGPWAQQHGVIMFEDDEATGATGPHIHLGVNP
jgi:hypothetical protein